MPLPSANRPLRVLLLEDNARDANLCKAHLERAGFNVETDLVASAEEFVAALRVNSYDIVLADYRLPNWSGIDALETLKQEGKQIPFILLTGTVGEEVAVDCIKRGATDYILKDRLARLALAVQRALDEAAEREERIRAEKSRDLLASIVESSDDAIIGIGTDGAILTWNHGAIRVYGYEPDQVRNRPAITLFAPSVMGELTQILESVRAGASVGRYETQGVTRQGRTIEVAVTLSPIRSAEGQIEGTSAIIRDITDHKRLQHEFLLAQKMEAVGRLAAGVAHDFNNLLTVITGFSSIALTRLKEQDPLYSEITEIRKAGERAASLTRQLLAFSRKQVLQPRVLNLNDVVSEIDRMLRRLIGEDVDLSTILDPELGPIRADPGQVEQVIMNLVVNARDAMPQGGKLTIETRNDQLREALTYRHSKIAPGSYVTLAITDTGTGMDFETQARIFEPFFTTKARGEGTGLGLSTVYGIIEQSGGAILVYSEPGHGTSFKIYLPRVDERLVPEKPIQAGDQVKGYETILIVEDEDAVRSLVSFVLEEQGYRILLAEDGGAGLRVCEQNPGKIDLMISDVIMPSMSGGELAARLKKLRPEMKVLFMSGYTDNAIVHHGVLQPGIAFIEKPFSPTGLARKVRDVLDGTRDKL